MKSPLMASGDCWKNRLSFIVKDLPDGNVRQPMSRPKRSVSPAPTGAEFSQSYTPDPVMLFRYSALTFNSHRIHYDLNFCRNEEGYPDLVVHGPLIATLLLDLFCQQQPNQPLVTFTYRSHSPLFNPQPFSVNGRANGQVWAANHEGGLAMLGQMVVGD